MLKSDLVKGFKELGLREDDNVIVHTSLSKLDYICGGALTVIEALLEVCNKGTIVMPCQSWKNLDPDTGVHYEVDKSDYQMIRDNWPAYDKKMTPTNTMGIVAETFRNYPGSVRSDHPARSFCANGKYAEYLMSDHDLSDIFGESSPLGKLYKLDAKVLLIGVSYDKNTSLHLADVRADYPSKHTCIEHSAIMEDGKRVWKAYETLYVDGNDFVDIGEAFEKECNVNSNYLGKCMSQKELVDFAVKWIEDNRS